MPHMGDDPIVAAAALIGAIQTIVSRTVNPQDEAVVTVTQMHGGNTWNIVPEEVVLRGTCRYFKPAWHQVLDGPLRRRSAAGGGRHGRWARRPPRKPAHAAGSSD